MDTINPRKTIEKYLLATCASLQEIRQLAHDNCHGANAIHTHTLSNLQQLLALNPLLAAQYGAPLADTSTRLQTIQELSTEPSIPSQIQQTAQYTLKTLATIETLLERENAIQLQQPKIEYNPHSFTSLVTCAINSCKETYDLQINYAPTQDITIPANKELIVLALENLFDVIAKTTQPHSKLNINQSLLEQNERNYAICNITYQSNLTLELLQQLKRIQRIPLNQHTELLNHAAVSDYIIKEVHNGMIKYKLRPENTTHIEIIL